MNTGSDASRKRRVRLFFCGDVMTGRGIDQILPHPCDPQLHESYCHSARDYVALAEEANGKLPHNVDCAYPWGDALAVLNRFQPDARIINLETAVTSSEDAWPRKEVLYRMHPDNLGCITSARIDCCVLANNHSLDWGRAGLEETLATLHHAGIGTAGAGPDLPSAAAPAIISLGGGTRLLVYAYGAESGGVPSMWAATARRSGVNFLSEITARRAEAIGEHISAERRAGDLVVVSLHWGPNWGFDVGEDERAFAHRLIDTGAAQIVYGHSSHHVKGMEVYRERLILYGCGDFLNDYEGIGGDRRYRADLALMYFPLIDSESGAVLEMAAMPMQIRRFQSRHAENEGASWLRTTLSRECGKFGANVTEGESGALLLSVW
jgi:poly-gamma-glutamate capsule biosynthesis protein CapA/YwtB (metallophosphatase superfamily)